MRQRVVITGERALQVMLGMPPVTVIRSSVTMRTMLAAQALECRRQ